MFLKQALESTYILCVQKVMGALTLDGKFAFACLGLEFDGCMDA